MKIFGIAGWSGSGKTTLMIRLLPALVRAGLRVATIKHTHHDPALADQDSRLLMAAGATEVMAASPSRFILMHRHSDGPEPGLAALAEKVEGVDLLLVEGFKFAGHPKLEVWAPHLGKSMLALDDPSVVAIASDEPVPDLGRPVFRRDDVAGIVHFIVSRDG